MNSTSSSTLSLDTLVGLKVYKLRTRLIVDQRKSFQLLHTHTRAFIKYTTTTTMLAYTPLVKRYISSFQLFTFRILDMIRVAPAHKLKSLLYAEVGFLLRLNCILIYPESKDEQINRLLEWFQTLSDKLRLEDVKEAYIDTLQQLNLSLLDPQKYLFSFTTIWDTIHLMAYMGDAMVVKRDVVKHDTVMLYMQNLKWVFYNLFIVLFCPKCARHYLTANIFVYEIERVEVALYRERLGEPIIMVQEETRSMATKNCLMTHHLLYKSMQFHNHVNGYRPIQSNAPDMNNFQRMEWSVYKNMLGIV
ncbi:p33 [Spodoptera frugiperda granulovirus]|uniref:p33 n=1 Tax=Spodoptera frugiperda granulovirus TaxID=307454 RepID=A0A0C5ASF4_9BBAC|nr:p33 [Spodoptera frugiperda granulovirus]AJK91747.1 p33 [Spodoptera frugiperda granulovirus]AXS01109.1 p33 [Spodoptera frugiperda granulovirus]